MSRHNGDDWSSVEARNEPMLPLNGMHDDGEKELAPTIATFSFGACATMDSG